MRASAIVGGNYLKAADLQGQEVTVMIDHCSAQVMEDGKQKIALRFAGKQKGLLLNKTNTRTLVAALGDETDAWVGKQITLYSTNVDFQGSMVPAIRVRAAGAAPAPHPPPAQPQQPAPQPQQPAAPAEGEIPF